ncbi:MAG: LPS assembly protein LptD [Gammaproteobacteria bacterium]|nr:LPS assembly protein LptD [Gammaproteobacteria bacterium]
MSKTISNKLGVSILGSLCLVVQATGQASAERVDRNADQENQNPTHLVCQTAPDPETVPAPDPDAPVQISADSIERDGSGTVTLQGAVQIRRGAQVLDADLLHYQEHDQTVQAHGDVRIEDGEWVMEGAKAQLNLDTGYFKSDSIAYRYKPLLARGQADHIERTSRDFAYLENTTYTTCAEGDDSWELAAGTLELDRNSGDGIGKKVTARFMGIPVFYTPWIRFPIDDARKSGFLAPTFGNSSDSGPTLEIPWYWNIASNQDAILTPRLLADRGLQLKSSYRHLNRAGLAQFGVEYLDDRDFDDDRYLASIEYQGALTPGIELQLSYNRASDKMYFEDLGDGLGLSSTQYIEQFGRMSYQGQHWELTAFMQGFQAVDSSLSNEEEPFKRLPQLEVNGNYLSALGGFDFFIENEWVRFQHDDKIDGERLHSQLAVERPFGNAAYFVRPGIRLAHTRYDLHRKDGLDDKPTRSVPSIYLDTGLKFERDLKDSANIQSLEPRIYYLHTPFRDQAEIPLFDTKEYEFGFEQLFRNRRFSGHDRIGEADHLSVGVTSRILNTTTGREKLRASVGRIFYFRDRKTWQPGVPEERSPSSEVAAELKLGLSERWEAIGSILMDTRNDRTQRNSIRFHYRDENNRLLNLAYLYRHKSTEPLDPVTNRQQSLEQSDVSTVLPLNNHWRAVTRWNYDLQNKRNLELLAGLEYETCCWKLRLAGRRYSQNVNEDYNTSIEFQLVLKGLGQIGSPLGELLKRGVRGYDDKDDLGFY